MLRHNHRQLEEQHGVAMYRKETFIDTSEDIAMVKKYLDEKLGGNRAECLRHTKVSHMTETELDSTQVGWWVMLQKEQKLRDWLAGVIDRGELGAVGEAPPDLAAELGIDMDALNAHVDADGIGAEEELGAMEVTIDVEGETAGTAQGGHLGSSTDTESSDEGDNEGGVHATDTPPRVDDEEEEEEEVGEESPMFVAISPIPGDTAPYLNIKWQHELCF